MSDFWTNLAAKIERQPEAVRPRLPARFERSPAVEPEDSTPLETSSAAPQPGTAPPRRFTNIEPPSPFSTIVEQRTPARRFTNIEPPSPLNKIVEQATPPRAEPAGPAVIPPASGSRPVPAQPPVELPPGSPSPTSPQPRLSIVSQAPVEGVIERRPESQAPAPPRLPVINLETTSITPSQVSPAAPAPPIGEKAVPPEIAPTPPDRPPEVLIRPKVAPTASQSVVNQLRPEASAQPAVQVTIGRIEVRGVTPPPAQRSAPQRRPRFQPPLTLEAYLNRRKGEAP